MKGKQHLDLEARLQIETGLNSGLSIYQIAKNLGKNHSTISREIRSHAVESDKGAYGRINNRCIHRYDCEKSNLCPIFPCSHPVHQLHCRCCSLCNSICKDFEEDICSRLTSSPYVCNGCQKGNACVLKKRYYLHKQAQEEYEHLLCEARTGANTSELGLKAIDDFLSPLIKNGQSPHNAIAAFPDRFPICEKTLYKYIESGLLSAKAYDLPRRPRLKPRQVKSTERKIDKKCRIGRSFDDFLIFQNEHPDLPIVQMDTVMGTQGGKCLLTFSFESLFLMAFLLDDRTSFSVINAMNYLTDTLSLDTFRRLFPVILTDNGTEFSNPKMLEFDCKGQLRTHIFYCDPNRSDQKGRIEVQHEMLRRIFPKGSSFDNISQNDLDIALSHINSYMREKLNDKSPYESFSFFYGVDILHKLGLYRIPATDIILQPSLIKH